MLTPEQSRALIALAANDTPSHNGALVESLKFRRKDLAELARLRLIRPIGHGSWRNAYRVTEAGSLLALVTMQLHMVLTDHGVACEAHGCLRELADADT